MPRGKKKIVNLAEKIEAVKAEIEALTAQLKEKKAELKKLEAEQAEEDKAKLIEAFVASGKTVDEVVAWLKGE
jgi:cell division protein FtsB